MLISSDLDAILEKLRHGLKLIYGEKLAKLILFGSQARGEAGPYSDIDIALILTGTIEPTAETSKIADITAPLSLENDIVISCFCVSENRYQSEDSPFLRNLRREGLTFE